MEVQQGQQGQTAIIRNLEDAGCDVKKIDDFLVCWQGNKKPEALRLLTAHRRFLLDALHVAQKRIDCLDYLIYRINGKE